MSRGTKPKRRAGCLAWLILLLLLAGGVAAAAQGGRVLLAVRRPAALALTVQLRRPATGGQAELNQPLGIEAGAQSVAGVTRVELYADGALAAVQESTLPTGSNPLLFLQTWTPLSPGRHALVARAYDNTGLFADSNVVYVDAAALIDPTYQINTDVMASGPGEPLPSLNDVAASLGVVVQQLLDLNPVLAGGDLSAPLPSGETLNVPRTPAPPPAATPAPSPIVGLPAAPVGLAAALACSDAQLSWGAVDGVSQYSVYRLGPGDSAPQQVAAVSGATFSDSLPGLGEYRYQVASQGTGGESLSAMVTVSTPGTCVPPALPPGTVDIDLAAIALEADAAFDGVYCYLSVDGSPFERVPRADFSLLTADAGGLHYDLAAQLPNHGQFVLAAHADSAPVRLTGDCWGRAGPLSIPLGIFATDDPPVEWNGAQQQTWSLPANPVVSAAPGGFARTGALALANARVRLTYSLSAAQPQALAGTEPLAALVEAYGLPAPEHLRIENSILACEELAQEDSRRSHRLGGTYPHISIREPSDHKTGEPQADPLAWLSEPFRQALGEQAACMISAALGGAPTLLWDWSDDTGHFSQASLTGYHVVVTLTDLNLPQPTDAGFVFRPARTVDDFVSEGLFWQRDIRPGARLATLARLADLPCSVRLDYTVAAVFAGRQSLPSDVLSFESEPCENQAVVTVDIDTLLVGPVNDRGDACPFDCSTDTLEVTGYIFAGARQWDSQRQWLSDPGETRLVYREEGGGRIYNTEVVRSPNPLNRVAAGRYAWAEQWLAVEYGSRFPNARHMRQRWRFSASPTTTIPIGTRLNDWNGAGGLQLFCNTDYEIPARRATVWFATDETFTLRDTRGEATCEISVHVVGARIDYSAHP